MDRDEAWRTRVVREAGAAVAHLMGLREGLGSMAPEVAAARLDGIAADIAALASFAHGVAYPGDAPRGTGGEGKTDGEV